MERIQAALSAALNWDLTGPMDFMVKREGHHRDKVESMAREYRRFMGIIALNPGEKFAISSEVDPMWHAHQLFTEDYNNMGAVVSGKCINHKPILTEEESVAVQPFYTEGTLKAYEKLYGKPSTKWWPANAAVCLGCGEAC